MTERGSPLFEQIESYGEKNAEKVEVVTQVGSVLKENVGFCSVQKQLTL